MLAVRNLDADDDFFHHNSIHKASSETKYTASYVFGI
jgi:hypothetical protein